MTQRLPFLCVSGACSDPAGAPPPLNIGHHTGAQRLPPSPLFTFGHSEGRAHPAELAFSGSAHTWFLQEDSISLAPSSDRTGNTDSLNPTGLAQNSGRPSLGHVLPATSVYVWLFPAVRSSPC